MSSEIHVQQSRNPYLTLTISGAVTPGISYLSIIFLFFKRIIRNWHLSLELTYFSYIVTLASYIKEIVCFVLVLVALKCVITGYGCNTTFIGQKSWTHILLNACL